MLSRISYKAMRSNEIVKEALEAGHSVPCPWIGKLIDLEDIPKIILSGDYSPLKDPDGMGVDPWCWHYLKARRREQGIAKDLLEMKKGREWMPDSGMVLLDPNVALQLPRRPYQSFFRKKREYSRYLLPVVYLIFNQKKELVYIGQTIRLSSRLLQHLSTEGSSASLLRYVADDFGIIPSHTCRCGEKISCKTSFRPNSSVGRKLASMVTNEFSVCPILTPEKKLKELESLLQNTLRPKYIGWV